MQEQDAGSTDSDARPGTAASVGPDTLHTVLDVIRQLRARERGYLADLLHDGPMQDLAALALELGMARGDGSEGMIGHVDGVGRDLRRIQDELWPFPPAERGLIETLRQRTAWLLDTPLAVAVGDGAAALTETDVQAAADVVELILSGLETAGADGRPIVRVRADQAVIFLELNLTPAAALDPAFDGPAVEAWLHRVTTAITARAHADLSPHRLRIRIEIPSCPDARPRGTGRS